MKRKYIILGLLVSLTSCGQDVALALDKDIYHGAMFVDNMYQDTIMATTLAPENINGKTTYTVASDDAIVGIAGLKPADNQSVGVPMADDVYAQTNKLSLALPRVRYGFESKLFDGILHCSDAIRQSKSRLQLRESGFGYVFPSVLGTYDYVGLYLKAGADTSSGGAYIDNPTIKLSFYVPAAGAKFDQHEFVMEITGIRQSDFPQFYGFYFDDAGAADAIAGATAFSFAYEIPAIEDAADQKDYTAVFIYELLLPKSSWN